MEIEHSVKFKFLRYFKEGKIREITFHLNFQWKNNVLYCFILFKSGMEVYPCYICIHSIPRKYTLATGSFFNSVKSNVFLGEA